MRWTPHVTVAAVIEQNGTFLLVKENIDGNRVFNQPAGHLESGESLYDAVVRETREETAWVFEPGGIVGIYRWRAPGTQETFLRVTFHGRCTDHDPDQALDKDIIATHWLTRDEIIDREPQLRSPLVLQSIKDFQAGKDYPLSLLVDL